MTRIVHPRVPARRGARRAGTWWGKAWLRAVEEAAFTERDVTVGRRLARSGRVGQIAVEAGGFFAAVEDGEDVWTVSGELVAFGEEDRRAFVETVGAEAGRIAALVAGELPHALVEHAEEAGIELLPYGGEIDVTCTCDTWLDPCPHALAVLLQLTWLIDDDPFVLLSLRGLTRDELLSRLHERESGPTAAPDIENLDLEAATDAALRAARVLALLEDPGARIDHLF